MEAVYIYTLAHPITKEVRYIGKTNNLRIRYNSHIKEAYKLNTHKHCWVKSLLSKGLKPIIEVLDTVHADDWQSHEKYWIAQFKAWGFRLINHTEGGEGGNAKGRVLSSVTKNKIGQANTGKQHTATSKALLSKVNATLTKNEVLDIVDMIEKGISRKYICNKYNLSRSSIYDIHKRISYQWVWL